MYRVEKRNGKLEDVNLEKVSKRLLWLSGFQGQLRINPVFVAQKVINEIVPDIKTRKLDEYAAVAASNMADLHPDFLILAARIAINNHHKNTLDCFSSTMEVAYRNKDVTGEDAPRINTQFFKFTQIHKTAVNRMVDYERDYRSSYFAYKTVQDRYLLKKSGSIKDLKERPQDFIIERLQDLWMRVACAIHMNRLNIYDTSVLPLIKETYDGLSLQKFVHATPTLFNLGTLKEQGVSCFLLGGGDSTESIMELATDFAKISRSSGGIGWHWALRSAGVEVKGINGKAGGIIPFMRIMQDVAEAFDQGSKRPGSFASYQSPFHPEFIKWLDARNPRTGECQNLFYGAWIPDVFMEAVEQDKLWYFLDPRDCPQLYDSIGQTQREEYERCIKENKSRYAPVKARDVWNEILTSQKETSQPFMLFSDACNLKSNQGNLGVIKSSNLCVAGDTLILTKDGYKQIKDLQDKTVDLWNGEEWSRSLVKKTNDAAELLEIETCSGKIIKCTPYHKFILDDNEKIIDAKDLKIGDHLIKFNLPKEFNTDNPPNSIKSIKKLEGLHPTWCFGEPKRNRGIFNGLLLGNCTEIIEYSDEKETACCVVSTLCLGSFVEIKGECDCLYHKKSCELTRTFNHQELFKWARVVVRNLNKVIDFNHYPTDKARLSNMKHRPLAIGIMGLADVFSKMRYGFTSPEARKLNKEICETLYFACLSESNELAKIKGPYQSFKKKSVDDGLLRDSDFSKGILQWHYWGVKKEDLSGMWDWESLIESIKKYGTRNSLLTSFPPTASTAHIQNMCECFEPYMEHMYTRKTSSGTFYVITTDLINDLLMEGIDPSDIRKELIRNKGSIQEMPNIPQWIKEVYKTVWELDGRELAEMHADMCAFIDQSASINRFIKDVTTAKLSSMHFKCWKLGLKTGMYYLRQLAMSKPVNYSEPVLSNASNSNTSNSNTSNSIVVSNTRRPSLSVDPLPLKANEPTEENSLQQFREEQEFKESEFTCPLDPEERKKCESCMG